MRLQKSLEGFVSRNPAFRDVLSVAAKLANSNVPILIEGESGTGKEWLGRAVHFAGPRAEKEFIVVDCTGGPDALLESELFGYMRGSFAGAIHDKKGLLELADGGTLFIDQIWQMKPVLQGKMIRLLTDSTFYKIGGVSEIRTDIRLIASTDRDLSGLVQKGKFREDFYYRLSAMRITIPPLRERKEDILQLAGHFLSDIAKREGTTGKELTREAQSVLESYSWPGNIRELEAEMERAVALSASKIKIGPNQLSRNLTNRRRDVLDLKPFGPGPLKDQKKKAIATLEAHAIRSTLEKTGGNKSQAAKLLSISRQDLLRKISAYKIKT